MMLIDDNSLKLLQPSRKPDAPALTEADRDAPGEHLVHGAEVQGEVVAKAPDGGFLVRIGGGILAMKLPENIQLGEILRLTFIGSQPRLSFALTQPGGQATRTTLSDLGRLLGIIGGEGKSGDQPLSALTPAIGRVVDNFPRDTATVARRLHAALSGSGMFYESHLAEWAGGRRSLVELQEEPQARLPLPGAKGEEGASRPAHSSLLQAVDPQAIPLVKQQLTALYSGEIVWLGEAWPGQQMEWTVAEREAEPGTEEGKGWRTTLRLDLPNLGTVSATLDIHGCGVRLALITGLATSAAALKTGEEGLRDALAGAGLELREVVIKHETPAR